MKALSYEEYQRLSEGGLSVPVFRELPGDLRRPVSAFLSLASHAERAFLLERAERAPARSAVAICGATSSRGRR